MKNLQAPIAGILLLLVAAGCRKDLNENMTPEVPESNIEVAAATVGTNGITESAWEAGSEWTTVEQPSFTVYHTNIKSDAVSADAAEKGMIRVFKTDDNGQSTRSLPFEETKGSQRLYWYYQVTEGNIMIAVDVYGNKSNPATSSQFKNIVITSDAVTGFEAQGQTKADLMRMSHDNLSGK